MIAAERRHVSDDELGEIERSACPTCGSCSGMFTANSMNCLNEALGLALPGNGTLLATHARRWELFEDAGTPHRRDGEAPLRRRRRPRAAAQHRHLRGLRERHDARHRHGRLDQHRAAPPGHRARGRRRLHAWRTSTACRAQVPNICKVAPSSQYHVEDVHRAGGIFTILGELDRAGLIHRDVAHRARARRMGEAIDANDIRRADAPTAAAQAARAGRAGRRAARRSPSRRTSTSPSPTPTRETGCIRDVAHAYSKDGGLAVLYGNLADDGCIVKTAGVDESIWTFEGPARVFHSQEAACDAILADQIKPGDVVVIVYEGPKGGPGMQEMLYPTSYLKGKGLGQGLRARSPTAASAAARRA